MLLCRSIVFPCYADIKRYAEVQTRIVYYRSAKGASCQFINKKDVVLRKAVIVYQTLVAGPDGLTQLPVPVAELLFVLLEEAPVLIGGLIELLGLTEELGAAELDGLPELWGLPDEVGAAELVGVKA